MNKTVKDIWNGLCENKIGFVCVAFLILVIIAAICAPLSPYDANAIDATAKLQGISKAHWLGTDDYGRDYFTRILYGSQVSLMVGVFSMIIAICFGTFLGTIAGYFGGKTDSIIMRLTDVFLSLPAYLVALVIRMLMEPTLFTLILILSLFAWPTVARITRAETMTLKHRDFVTAAKNLGAGNIRIIFKHIIPNMMNSITVAATLSIAGAILAESFLSYLGLGVQLPRASWGSMLQDAQLYMLKQPILAIAPGLLILFTVLSFNVLGDVLQKILEPKRNK
jgi:peptide/nickel transport system permease protein